MTPLFSVVIPLYNRADVIASTVGSVLNQDFTDFEVVIVDDGSSDDPAAALRTLTDPRVRLVRQDNAGGGAARTTGISESRGRYIAFLDSDDRFLPGKLRVVADEILSDPDTVLYSQMQVDRGVGRYWVRPERGIRAGEDVGEYLFCANQIMQTSTLVVPSELARKVMFDPALRRGQDLDFCVRLQAAGARFRMIPKPLTIWWDGSEAGRTSYVSGAEQSTKWLEKRGPLLTRKAVRGYRATVLAYHLARISPATAAKDLMLGWLVGGVPLDVTVRQALRSFLPKSMYRGAVNAFVERFGRDGRRA